jgi:hypothetical protein
MKLMGIELMKRLATIKENKAVEDSSYEQDKIVTDNGPFQSRAFSSNNKVV